jgi:hypothetical protein
LAAFFFWLCINQLSNQHLQIQRMIWLALTGSLLVHTFVLYQIGKISFLETPDFSELGPIEMISLGAGFLVFLSFHLYRSKVDPAKSYQERLIFLILSLIINETIVLIAFVATFLGNSGNGFLMAENVLLCLVGNLLMFPKEISTQRY